MAEGTPHPNGSLVVVSQGIQAVWLSPALGTREFGLFARLDDGDTMLVLDVMPTGHDTPDTAVLVLCKHGLGYTTDNTIFKDRRLA